MSTPFTLAQQVGRVPSMRVRLDAAQELRYQRLMDDLLLIDVHQHPMVLVEPATDMPAYFRSNSYAWAFDAVKAGKWTAVATANLLSCLGKEPDASFSHFEDLVDEVGMMLADVHKQCDSVLKVTRTQDILDAQQSHKIGWLPTLEHLSIGHDLHRVDVLYGIGIRLAGLTYMRKSYIGDGQYERTDCGLSDFGMDVIKRMNEIGMVIDLSHAGSRTALETIALSEVPVVFSHNAAPAIRPTRRSRSDEDLLACAAKGGLCCVTAVPNSLSDDPHQDINCAWITTTTSSSSSASTMLALAPIRRWAITSASTACSWEERAGQSARPLPGRAGIPRRRPQHHPRPDRPRLRRPLNPQNRRPERP